MDYGALYNEEYYKTSCGEISYLRADMWMPFYENVADRIIESLHPTTVLDVGCAVGYLVAALRDRGVEAYGIDASEFAISKVREDIKPFCRVCSVLDDLPYDLPKKYDLVITIEVAEHLYEEDSRRFIDNICKYSDQIIFSSTPDDFSEKTHFNVQQPEYWAKKFAENGFLKVLTYDATYISPQASLFIRCNNKIERVIEDYERNARNIKSIITKINREKGEREQQIIDLDNLLKVKEQQIANIEKASYAKDERIAELQGENDRLQKVITERDVRISDLIQEKLKQQNEVALLEQSLTHARKDNDRLQNSIIERDAKNQELVLENLKLQKEIALLEQSLTHIQEDNDKLQNSIIERDARIQDLIEENKKQQKKLMLLEKSLTYLQEDNDKNTSIIAERDARIQEFIRASEWLHGEVARWQSSYNSIARSSFWIMTKPLRVFVDALKWLTNCLIHNFFTRNVKKFVISVRNIGFKNTLRKVKGKLKGQSAVEAAYISTSTIQPGECSQNVNFLLNSRMRGIQPIQTVIVENGPRRLNLVTDSIESHSLLGGVATALIVATEFANQNDMSLRIITRTTPVNPVNYENIMRLSGVTAAKSVTYYSDYDRDVLGNIAYKLEISENDIFFATSWWSAAAIKGTSLRKKFFYIIQEVETFFYPHGDEHYLCSQIMQDKNIYYIINSHYLYEYFKAKAPNIVNHGVYFEPAFPKTLYQPQQLIQKKKFNFFFYARPNNPRNLFNYGISLIEKSIESGLLDTNEWDIYCAGQDIPELKFSNGYVARNLGLMSWEEYTKFLGSVDLALSLMYTPHPSYLPFDVACSGGVVITNCYENKESFEWCKNVIYCSLDENQFLGSMEKAIALAKDIPQRMENFANSTIPRVWQDTLQSTLEFMREKLKDV